MNVVVVLCVFIGNVFVVMLYVMIRFLKCVLLIGLKFGW